MESITLKRILKWYFLATHSVLILCNLFDSVYFRFSGKRMSMATFYLGQEFLAQAGQFSVNYFYVPLIWLILSIFLFSTFPSSIKPSPPSKGRFKTAGAIILIIYVHIVFARGGYTGKVLRPVHAYLGDPALAALKLNSTFTVITSNYTHNTPRYNASRSQITDQLKPVDFASKFKSKRPQNIVIMIVESLSSDLWFPASGRKDIVPFLNKLSERSLISQKHFSNGRTSIDALPSILFGYPLLDEHWARSNYQTNCWQGLGSILLKEGYQTQFFHGADKPSMYFDAISAAAGIAEHYHREHVTAPEADDGHWGIYDEPFLQFTAHQLSKNQKPFLSTIFTLSSHQPFALPEVYRRKFNHIKNPFERSLRYTDHAIGQFFATIETQPWYEDTLFIITGDHTFADLEHPYMKQGPGRFRVPLILYHPRIKFNEEIKHISHHADIYASVLDFLKLETTSFPLISKSIWNQNQKSYAFFKEGGDYLLALDDSLLKLNPLEQITKNELIFDLSASSPIGLKDLNVEPKDSQFFKSILAYYYRSLQENSVYDWIPHRNICN